ncbi:hypothetical protein [Mycolicibacterium septicum]|uniref:hypothetical protein n=1 Tax=Mycolicibacterium septicum TaxID=98668 RepID=UPI001AF3083F|nr:hypothetical protein [Mycolicibacterium septicum]QRY51822.1 hypothetical protein JVX95_31360 [Mycolicibacterium septicum]
MSKIGKKIAKEVKRLAAESPDFIYPYEDCKYIHNGEPSCLYGHALFNLGLIDSSFERKLGKGHLGNDTLLNFQPIDTVLQQLDIKLDNDEVGAFIGSQDDQDNGRPWDVAARPLENIL